MLSRTRNNGLYKHVDCIAVYLCCLLHVVVTSAPAPSTPRRKEKIALNAINKMAKEGALGLPCSIAFQELHSSNLEKRAFGDTQVFC